jgi:hypothetical protein
LDQDNFFCEKEIIISKKIENVFLNDEKNENKNFNVKKSEIILNGLNEKKETDCYFQDFYKNNFEFLNGIKKEDEDKILRKYGISNFDTNYFKSFYRLNSVFLFFNFFFNFFFKFFKFFFNFFNFLIHLKIILKNFRFRMYLAVRYVFVRKKISKR